ncbi:serine protease, partial [Rubripirellula amarantea]|nr:serine protease [Rubripirellula amarantea]
MKTLLHLLLIFLGICVCLLAGTSSHVFAEESIDMLVPSESETNEHMRSIAESVDLTEPSDLESAPLATGVNSAADLVAMVRPSVVLIRTPFGSGTGFVYGSGRYIVTNNHVIQDAPWDNQAKCQVVKIHFGSSVGDRFQLNPEAVWGKVHRISRRKDLAVIEFQSLPPGMDRPPSLSLADTPPREGADCYAIGMPAAGFLWTVRSGIIAGHDTFPGGLENQFRLGTGEGFDEKRRAALMKHLAPEGSREITLSTCGINPGDSGGPLVDSSGKLVAVTFAVPSD